MAEYFEVKAVEKYIRMSPRKIRIVADLVRGKRVDDAIALLKLHPRVAAKEVEKAIHSAASNATAHYGLERGDLYVTSIFTNEAPTLKRFKAGARGRYKPIFKRSAHLTVGVAERGGKKAEEK